MTTSHTTVLPPTVLVVDDEQLVLDIFARIIPSRGLSLKVAKTGEEGLALMRGEAIGCLLTDKNLPGIDGIELMRATRQEQPYCACIVMTAYASTASAIDALRLGATDYLEKPFQDLDLVLAKVEGAMQVQRTAYERDAFLVKIGEFRDELADRDQQVASQAAQLSLINKVVEQRVAEATADLTKKCAMLESCLSSTADSDFAIGIHCESILDDLKAFQLQPNHPIAQIRAHLSRIQRRLDSHLGLIRQVQKVAEASRAEKPKA